MKIPCIGVVTVGRSDYSIYLPFLKRLKERSDYELEIYVSGMHLSHEFGLTLQQIEKDGFCISAKIPTIQAEDTQFGVGKAMGLGVTGFSEVFNQRKPDLLVVLGDRFDMFAAALAAVPFNIPILHLHGGELTEGAMDDRFRHALTKLSHLHAVSTETYYNRVIQLGEEPWRVCISGALALDLMRMTPLLSAEALSKRFNIDLSKPTILATLHPTTQEMDAADYHVKSFLNVLGRNENNIVFTLPNADMSGRMIRREIENFCLSHSNAKVVENFGSETYFSMLSHASVMIGNSSSGILEAASFELPVVNIGSRQQGRLRAANVLDIAFDPIEIEKALTQACSQEFRDTLKGLKNPYGDGAATDKILAFMDTTLARPDLLQKKFYDL